MLARLMTATATAGAALVCALAPDARAMAIYNNSSFYQGGVAVTFICGFMCGWIPAKGIAYHTQEAYPGKGGSFEIDQEGCIMSSGHPNIDNHGYAVLTGTNLNTDMEWHMWDNDGNVVSDSPFPVICFPSPGEQRLRIGHWVERQFRTWDTDHDGSLSAREVQAGVRRDFSQMDLDHDRVIDDHDVRLDLEARGAHRPQSVARTLLPFDLNHNGRTSLSEYERYIRLTFVAPMDRNHDGRISRAEAIAFYASLTTDGVQR